MSENEKFNAGYTLLELLVVMTIIGLCYALIPSKFVSGNSSLKFNATLQQIVGDMRRLRSKSVLNGEILNFEINEDGQGYIVLDNEIFLEDEMSLRGNINNFPDNRISFYPDGTSSGFKIILFSEGRQKSIISEWPTGRIIVDES